MVVAVELFKVELQEVVEQVVVEQQVLVVVITLELQEQLILVVEAVVHLINLLKQVVVLEDQVL